MATGSLATADAGTPNADPNQVQLQIGMTGDQVKALQQHLMNWGFNPGPLDGQFGTGTELALKAFQQYHNLPVTGAATNLSVQYLQSNALWEAVRQGFHTPGTKPGVPLGPTNLTMPPGAAAPGSGPAPAPAPSQVSPTGYRPAPVSTVPGAPGYQPPPAPRTDAEIDAWVRQKYGSYAWMLDDPAFAEVRNVLREGARNQWGDQELLATLKNTNYWKTTQDSSRKWDTLKKTDPAQATALIENVKSKLRMGASRMGVELSDERLNWMAEESQKMGWDDVKFQAALAAEAVYKPDFGGDIGAYETQAKALARSYLMPLADEAAFNLAKKWAGGEIDEQNVTEMFKVQAKGLIPAFADQIEAGLIPRDLLSGQLNATAQLLEIDPETIDIVNDQRFNPIISSRDATGKPGVMTLSETQKHVKSLDDYWKTGNANKEVSSIVNGLARTFGEIK